MRNRFYSNLPVPVFEAEGGGRSGGDKNSFSADYVARMQADMDRLKEEFSAAKTGHADALKTLKAEHDAALKAAKTEAETALTAAQTAHAEALAAVKTEGETALTAAQQAAQQRMVHLALRAEAATAGMVDLDGLKMADQAAVGKLTVDEAGVVADAKPLIDAMKKTKPWLFGTGSSSSTAMPPGQQAPAAKKATDMTDAEFDAAMKSKAWRGAA